MEPGIWTRLIIGSSIDMKDAIGVVLTILAVMTVPVFLAAIIVWFGSFFFEPIGNGFRELVCY